jgi:hypothetical protein
MTQIERLLAQPTLRPKDVVVVLDGHLSRNGVYEAIARGEIESIRFGKKIIIPTAPLRRKLGMVG